MRTGLGNELLRAVSRFAVIGVVGGLAACTSDRMASNPFSDPFKTADAGRAEPTRTGSIEPGPGSAMPRSTIRSEALPPPSGMSSAFLSPPPSGPSRPRTASGGPGWSTTGGTTVIVGPGETLSTLTSRYGVPGEAILSSNGLKSADVTAGRRVVIPVYSATAEAGAAPTQRADAAPAPAPSGHVVSRTPIDVRKPAPRTVAEAAPARSQIRPGRLGARAPEPEPVRSAPRIVEARTPAKAAPPTVAAKPEPKAGPKVAAKPEPKPAKVTEREVVLPAKARPVATAKPTEPTRVATTKPSEPRSTEKVLEPKARPEPTKVATATPPRVEEPKASPSREPESTGAIAPSAPVSTAGSGGGPDFRWPAKGRVISGFGGGGSNEGINIAVPEGTAVKAAGDGVVAYAGSEVKGYGNLVLIRHDNGYVSAYANNGDIDVKRGQRVTRGQSIAKSGQTGNVTSPQLHFEIRKGSTPVDPMRYLASN